MLARSTRNQSVCASGIIMRYMSKRYKNFEGSRSSKSTNTKNYGNAYNRDDLQPKKAASTGFNKDVADDFGKDFKRAFGYSKSAAEREHGSSSYKRESLQETERSSSSFQKRRIYSDEGKEGSNNRRSESSRLETNSSFISNGHTLKNLNTPFQTSGGLNSGVGEGSEFSDKNFKYDNEKDLNNKFSNGNDKSSGGNFSRTTKDDKKLKTNRKPLNKSVSNSEFKDLKFDPRDEGDFTGLGILPFFQHTLNEMLLSPAQVASNVPDFNITPTLDQRKILSILGSKHNLLLKGELDSGKTLAVLLYALNLSLSATPRYDLLESKHGLDSVIIVPTEDMVNKCERYIGELLQGIPENCCPDKLLKYNDEYELTRSSLAVEFIYGHENSIYSTGELTKPRILVTTIEGIEKLIRSGFSRLAAKDSKSSEEVSTTQITPEYFESVKFVGVTSFDLFLKTSILNSTDLINKSEGKKGKYTHKLESIIKSIQDLSCNSFSSMLRRRLDKLENKYKWDNDISANRLNHTNIVMNYNPAVEEENDPLKLHWKVDAARPDNVFIPALYKLLSKQKRKTFYKSIQYAFVGLADEPYKRILELKQTSAKQIGMHNSISTKNPVIRSKADEQLAELYHDLNKSTGPEDTAVKFVENAVRFTNAQRSLRENERTIVTATSEPMKLAKSDSIEAMFGLVRTEAQGKNPVKVSNIDILRNGPNTNAKVLEHMDNHLALSLNNYKNYEKAYLKSRISALSKNKENSIIATIGILRQNFANDTIPFLIVVPDSTDVKILVDKLNADVGEESELFEYFQNTVELQKAIHKIHETNDISESTTYLFVKASQMLVCDMDGISRMVLVGLDTILPQFALSANSKEVNLQGITGLVDPLNDLSSFYLSKLKKSTTQHQKLVVFILSQSEERSKSQREANEQEQRKFAQILMYNNLHSSLNIVPISSVPTKQLLKYG